MSFISSTFLIFLCIVWLCFSLAPTKARAAVLTIASYLFYGSWSVPFLLMILATTTVDYLCSKYIHATQSQTKRRIAVTVAIAVNLLVLGCFKYLNFILGSATAFAQIIHFQTALPPHLAFVLPLGISFYTFEAISYVVDVYRGKTPPAQNFWQYNFYIMYFPHLISGPIIRYSELRDQYSTGIEKPSSERLRKGLELIVLGFAFKVLIADRCGAGVDPVFASPLNAGTLASYLAAAAFRAQLYFDFLGYTHIARGVSLLFNIELPLNFDQPFSATNMSNFWERWHISLGRWIRDYIYRPLGGSRHGLARTLLTIFVVFALAGAWHGAGWTYIAWGVFHGCILVAYYCYTKIRPRLLGAWESKLLDNSLYRNASIFFTYAVGTLGIVLFRAPNIPTAMLVWHNLVNLSVLKAELGQMLITNQFDILFSLALAVFLCLGGEFVTRMYQARFQPLSLAVKIPAAAAACLLCWILNATAAQQFIYFQF
ncbi:MAG TPA: MBOAT family O-acyltransferase [Planktothrix sp.]|jgi:alginate O-acetyltransferase complex protein AlgI